MPLPGLGFEGDDPHPIPAVVLNGAAHVSEVSQPAPMLATGQQNGRYSFAMLQRGRLPKNHLCQHRATYANVRPHKLIGHQELNTLFPNLLHPLAPWLGVRFVMGHSNRCPIARLGGKYRSSCSIGNQALGAATKCFFDHFACLRHRCLTLITIHEVGCLPKAAEHLMGN